MTPVRLAALLDLGFAARRPSFANERELQLQIGGMLDAIVRAETGLLALPEFRLDPKSRVDFRVHRIGETAGLGVEIKIKGSLAEVTRQLYRYAEHPGISGLVLVTTKYAHRDIPAVLVGKPCRVLCLGDFLL